MPTEMRANPSVNRTAEKLRFSILSALRAPAAGYLRRYASDCCRGNRG